MTELQLTDVNVYPVKSLGGMSLNEATLTSRGLEFDRNWMVVDTDGEFVTQRQNPNMATIAVSIDEENLILSADGKQDLYVPLERDLTQEIPMGVLIHGEPALGLHEGREAAAWLTEVLGTYRGGELLLVRFPTNYQRVVDPETLGDRIEHTAFADQYPLLVTSKESLDELNRRLEENGSSPVSMDRFRPNLVVEGASAFAEDSFVELSIGENVRLELLKPSARCPITTIDQQTGEKPEPKEPLRTLAQFRKQNGKVLFGQNAVVASGDQEELHVGDAVIGS
jgi:hypothetical protein